MKAQQFPLLWGKTDFISKNVSRWRLTAFSSYEPRMLYINHLTVIDTFVHENFGTRCGGLLIFSPFLFIPQHFKDGCPHGARSHTAHLRYLALILSQTFVTHLLKRFIDMSMIVFKKVTVYSINTFNKVSTNVPCQNVRVVVDLDRMASSIPLWQTAVREQLLFFCVYLMSARKSATFLVRCTSGWTP